MKSKQAFANEKLKAKGHLFLNEVYESLGFPEVPEGQIVGWIYDPRKDIDGREGDDYIDFGFYDKVFTSEAVREFINGAEPCVWLDFNVDGVVWDLI